MGDDLKCALCSAELGAFTYKAMPNWNVAGLICGSCYDKKLIEHYIAPERRDVTKK